MKTLAILASVVLLGACAAATCERPSLFEPIEHCTDCKWNGGN